MRSAGVLLHATSLPGAHGIGDLGPGARDFADWLARAGQQWWQLLPIHPVGAGDSPYSGTSAFAGEPLLVSKTDLVAAQLLRAEEVDVALPADRADYAGARAVHQRLIALAFDRFTPDEAYARFVRETPWLDDFALFQALDAHHATPSWTTWPEPLRLRTPAALATAREQHAREIAIVKFEQFLFSTQWTRLRAYCHERKVRLIGDIPIFVAHHSADVWAHPQFFRLDDRGEPTHVAGVPPDYFSKTGQRWGNPHYAWDVLAPAGYGWWIDRIRALAQRFDLVRLDHFIGFSRFWEIPAAAPTAETGRYGTGPGVAFFEAAKRALGSLPFIAEDLGEITPAVRELRDQFELPGMRVFQFAFGTDVQAAEFKPHGYPRRCVAYSGTHDNDTITGWFENPGPRDPAQHALEREAAIAYLAGPYATELAAPIHLEVLRALYASVAEMVIAPLQDVLGLSSDARMNIPGAATGNWSWRVDRRALTPAIADTLRALTTTYDR